MSTTFRSVEQAKAFAAIVTGVNPETFEEVNIGPTDEQIQQSLKEHADATEEERENFLANVAKLKAVKQFKGKNAKGVEFMLEIGPFRDGFDCFVFDPECKAGIRL